MKKRYLLIGSLALFQYYARAQSSGDTTTYKPRTIDVETVYNQYLQDGDNSAVTGGIGTEKLRVYSTAVHLKRSMAKNSFTFNFGVDVISSASTDNIDFIKSSASIRDQRGYLNWNYERIFSKNFSIRAGMGTSLESDYASWSWAVGFSKSDKEKLRTFSIDVQQFNDDLRWGRKLGGDLFEPDELIYPSELRGRQWFDIHRRKSTNIKTAWVQVLNKRNILGIYPELSFQKGLLSTPFHRVYFASDSVVVENLPRKRTKAAMAIKLNSFTGSNIILRNAINLYHDSFGIEALSLENETVIKLGPYFSLLPGFRIYAQSAAETFAPYQAHLPSEEFYTSDYDLSRFETYSGGMGFRARKFKGVKQGSRTKTITLRYYFIYRTTELAAHTISLAMGWSTDKVRKNPIQ